MLKDWAAYLAEHPEIDAIRRRADRPQVWLTCDGCGVRFDRNALFYDHGKSSLLRLGRHTLTKMVDLSAYVCSDECRARLKAEFFAIDDLDEALK
jgi:hypothetical protein